MANQYTMRDREILRALARLQLVSTSTIQLGFFPSLRTAQRRLQLLRTRGVITTHAKGLPGGYGSQGSRYWRLTRQGAELAETFFPQEPFGDNLVERAQRGSLRFFEHRDKLGELYMLTIRDRQLDADELTRAASAFGWAPEYEVAINYNYGGKKRRLIPDATFSAKATVPRRVFIELDRSTESRSRCTKTLKFYSDYVLNGHYGRQFPDGLVPRVLFATGTTARQKSLATAVKKLPSLALKVKILPLEEAVHYLRLLAGLADGVEAEPPVRSDAAISLTRDDLSDLRQLYQDYRALILTRRAAGDKIAASAGMLRVCQLLSAHHNGQ